MNNLPWVLLGIRTAPREDLGTSSAELVHGAPPTVPGDFIATPSVSEAPKTLLPALRVNVRSFMPTPTTRHGNKPSSIPVELRSSLFVFVRRDSHRPPLA